MEPTTTHSPSAKSFRTGIGFGEKRSADGTSHSEPAAGSEVGEESAPTHAHNRKAARPAQALEKAKAASGEAA